MGDGIPKPARRAIGAAGGMVVLGAEVREREIERYFVVRAPSAQGDNEERAMIFPNSVGAGARRAV
jgi:bifunctional DNA-binding transcriptional regulator/antitoxin component of YhaV-PrlF toxin-antitoxin module